MATKLRDRSDACCLPWKRMVSDATPGKCLPTFDSEGFMQGCDAWWSSSSGGENGPHIIPLEFCPWCGIQRLRRCPECGAEPPRPHCPKCFNL